MIGQSRKTLFVIGKLCLRGHRSIGVESDAGEMLMADHIGHRQAQNIADVVMHHTQEVNELIGLYKQQAASLDQLTDIMARLTRVLENVSSEISKGTSGLNASSQGNGKGVFPLFMGRHSGSMRGSSEW